MARLDTSPEAWKELRSTTTAFGLMPAKRRFAQLELDKIDSLPGVWNDSYRPPDFKVLVRKVAACGLDRPLRIICWKHGPRYAVIGGARGFHAARAAGLGLVPVRDLSTLFDEESFSLDDLYGMVPSDFDECKPAMALRLQMHRKFFPHAEVAKRLGTTMPRLLRQFEFIGAPQWLQKLILLRDIPYLVSSLLCRLAKTHDREEIERLVNRWLAGEVGQRCLEKILREQPFGAPL